MIQTEDVKAYLRIDYEEDDDFIADAIQAGYNYLKDAIDDFTGLYHMDESFAQKADMWVLTQWCPPMYDQREGMLTDRGSNLNYIARAMLTQLQMYRVEDDIE